MRQTKNRRWRTGFLRTVRGTMEHRVRDLLPQVTQPTLLVVGGEDRIVDPQQAIEAARMLPQRQAGGAAALRPCAADRDGRRRSIAWWWSS